MTNRIKITDLSKKYSICHENPVMYSTLREAMVNSAKSAYNKLRAPFTSSIPSKTTYEDFWALKDINLEINEGERVGIIGRNGAGKSTLLKILSKITCPTTGSLRMKGKVSSLLEVGTGFHPELTGKENIFLNGSILGMKHHEIKAKFDAIVDFAEVEKFLDTPVKRYSSGMIARLGFAVAAHLDHDILIVDEVLAVGDAAFQAKCLKTMNDLGDSKKTVLFVSHDINAVMNLCQRGVYLDQGKIVCDGPISHCVDAYMRYIRSISLLWTGDLGNEHIRFQKMSVTSQNDQKEFFHQNETAVVELEFELLKPSKNISLNIGVWNQRNQLIAEATSIDIDTMDTSDSLFKKRSCKIAFKLNCSLFHEGEYFIKLECSDNYRRIIEDGIIVKFPVYSQHGIVRSGHQSISGVSLGNCWEIN